VKFVEILIRLFTPPLAIWTFQELWHYESVTEEGEGVVIRRLGWYLGGETKEVGVTWSSERLMEVESGGSIVVIGMKHSITHIATHINTHNPAHDTQAIKLFSSIGDKICVPKII